jgi:CDP-4-dehydro-6-deoxyglucose reductase, E3
LIFARYVSMIGSRVQTFLAHVVRVSDLTHDVREIELSLDEPSDIAFAAGQFVSFQIPSSGLRYPLTRPYSIVSPPSVRAAVTLLFNLVPEGPGSSFLYALRLGDAVRFQGPAGMFVVREAADRDLLLVATGTGIAPLRSILLARLEQPGGGRISLVWGLRSERDLYYQDELRGLAAQYPRFSFVTTLSRPSDEWTGERGRVQRIVEERVDSTDGLAVYLCGSSGMIKAVTDIIRRKGVCPIHREQYYRDREPMPKA